MAKRKFTLQGAFLRPDLDCMCESRTFRNKEGIEESEYCFSTRTLSENEANEVIMFLDDRFCGAEPVNISDAPTDEGWVNYFMAEVAAMRRLVQRFESQEKKAGE